jgi:hypothetical protein
MMTMTTLEEAEAVVKVVTRVKVEMTMTRMSWLYLAQGHVLVLLVQ